MKYIEVCEEEEERERGQRRRKRRNRHVGIEGIDKGGIERKGREYEEEK